MTRPAAKGWCPGAYHPMISGDGLIVRVRPHMMRLTYEQALGLCDLATIYGSGLIDLTSRANLQIRGVRPSDHEALLAGLLDIGLLNDNPDLEGRRNILMTPLWRKGDINVQIAHDLTQRLADFPQLPAKMGFAIDAGPAPILQGDSADFRIEHAATGDLILRADGATTGRAITLDTAISALIDMAQWFCDTGGPQNRRMAKHVAKVPLPDTWQSLSPASPAAKPDPGPIAQGHAYGVAFGQIEAQALKSLLQTSQATAMRVTPWRLFLLENATAPLETGFISHAADPLLRMDAFPGAPFCASASVDTRGLARRLARAASGPVHVSGCAKGCARPRNCETTLVGRDGKFDLVRNGLPWDEPDQFNLDPDTLPDRIGDL